VQLGGQEYVSKLEGLGFELMLPHFFFEKLSPPNGGEGGGPTWKRCGVVGPRGEGRPA
jgi:hypothetical protein